MATLEVKNLNASWKSCKESWVLKNINFKVEQGDFICLSGPNGSGKSTLLSLMSGYIPDGLSHKKKGTVTIEGKDVFTLKRRDAARKIVYMKQNEKSLWNFSVRDLVVMGRYSYTGFSGIYSKEDFMVTDQVLEGVQLTSLADKSVFELSGGEWQKVRIARTLVQQSAFILLDEPVANLDFTYQDALLTFIKDYAVKINAGLIISIHDLNTAARYADKFIFLGRNNTFASGSREDLFKPELLKNIYEADFKVFEHPLYHCLQVCI
ncbi:ABC transporter ATP-binding protein [Treponema sp.]|uniref:ABC transporter ATP-binding protein n=1 Tax=Treponema sp. TaxID=166 RepID=UPI0025DF1EEF|nr:ABC transporter ATP-binding protein [Treponema sp.]MCR5217470.1 ABC transporter ATP-binding protein [Treponema sp.]